MASSTSTVAWLSVMVKHLQTVVKERTILKCSWDDSFGSLLLTFGCDDLEVETIHKVSFGSLLLTFGCDDLEVETIHKVSFGSLLLKFGCRQKPSTRLSFRS